MYPADNSFITLLNIVDMYLRFVSNIIRTAAFKNKTTICINSACNLLQSDPLLKTFTFWIYTRLSFLEIASRCLLEIFWISSTF